MSVLKSFTTAGAMLAICAGLLAGPPAQAQTLDELQANGRVRIGVLVGAPPYGSVDATGKAIGYDADVAALVGSYLDLPVELVQLTPPARIPALEAGRVDFLIATLARTPEREQVVSFTRPYSAFQVGIYAAKDAPVARWEDMGGMTVGVNRGSSVEGHLVEREEALDLTILRFEDDATTMQALFSGQVQAVASPEAQSNAAIAARRDDTVEAKFFFSMQPNSMTVRKGATELQGRLNEIIATMIETGELNAISETWIGSPLPELPSE